MPQYCVFQWELLISLRRSGKETRLLPKMKFIVCINMNFGSQQNAGYKCFLRNQCLSIVYTYGNYRFLFIRCKKKLNSCHKRSSTPFKDELWFPTKRRVQMVFPWKQCLNVMYPNGNYPFFFVHPEKKLYSYHKWSSFLEKGWTLTANKTKSSNGFLVKQMPQYRVFDKCLVWYIFSIYFPYTLCFSS